MKKQNKSSTTNPPKKDIQISPEDQHNSQLITDIPRLRIKRMNEYCYWSMDQREANGWMRIPTSLFDELINHQNECDFQTSLQSLRCPNCLGLMGGDGREILLHCLNASEEDMDDAHCDHQPILCSP